jgi:hypothetical protein
LAEGANVLQAVKLRPTGQLYCGLAGLLPQPPIAVIAKGAFVSAKSPATLEVRMRGPRKVESPEGRKRRLARHTEMRKDDEVANEAAIDRMVTRNIEQNGP